MKWIFRLGVAFALVAYSMFLKDGAGSWTSLALAAQPAKPQKAGPHLDAIKKMDVYIDASAGNQQEHVKAWAASHGITIDKIVIGEQGSVAARTKSSALRNFRQRFNAGTTDGIAVYGAQPGPANAPTVLWIKGPKNGSTDFRNTCVLMERGEGGEEWWCFFDSQIWQCTFSRWYSVCYRIV